MQLPPNSYKHCGILWHSIQNLEVFFQASAPNPLLFLLYLPLGLVKCFSKGILLAGDLCTLQKHPRYPILIGCDRRRIIALDSRSWWGAFFGDGMESSDHSWNFSGPSDQKSLTNAVQEWYPPGGLQLGEHRVVDWFPVLSGFSSWHCCYRGSAHLIEHALVGIHPLNPIQN